MTSLITQDPEKGEKGFPKLMIDPRDNAVILMYSATKGTVVHKGDNEVAELGFYSSKWEVDCFIDFTGTVELRND